jgi:hypothetical protein
MLMDLSTFEEYRPRRICFLELWTFDGWKIKVYNICEKESDWNKDFIAVAKSIAKTKIRGPEGGKSNHRIGFLTIHLAKQFNQIIFDWWACQNELRHFVFKAENDNQTFENITSSGEAFCIWELRVIQHERDSWVRNILRNPIGSDFIAYYDDVFYGYE